MAQDPSDFVDQRIEPPTLIDGIHAEFNYLEGYLSISERFFDQEAIAHRERYGDGTDPLDLLNPGTLFDVEKWYPDLLRKSFFVAIYSAVETNLINWCRDAEESKNLSLSLNDLAGQSNMEKASRYLMKVVGIKFPDTAEWNELKNYQKLRNLVVHNQGWLISNKKSRYYNDSEYLRNQYLQRHQSHLDLEGNHLIFKKGYCEDVISTVLVFFDQLDEAT